MEHTTATSPHIAVIALRYAWQQCVVNPFFALLQALLLLAIRVGYIKDEIPQEPETLN